ncbi:MAG TPA: response regulator [Pseudacidobacterium sp.]|jgi:CheY-like chemotaxis protein|nr:response regulator [Pseudacidobacterium sp.]
MPFNILLVDDDAVQALTRKAILASVGHNVWIANNAHEALHLLSDAGLARQVGLVITDHLMPRMNGPQFVSELRRKFPAMPILVLSGLPDGDTEYQSLNVLYRLKPLAPDELIELVQFICRTSLGRTA